MNNESSVNIITEITRRNIFDAITIEKIGWSGRLDEMQFLSRLFDLKSLPSTDHRFTDAGRDIWQHRVNNYDWGEDWVFHDPRFNLMYCEDELFLRFLCGTIHPVVRSDVEDVQKLVSLYNGFLRVDGFELKEYTRISEKPVFKGRQLNRSERLLDKLKGSEWGELRRETSTEKHAPTPRFALKIFICHASEDKPKARDLYRQLIDDGFDAWLDEVNILPGQEWELEIKKAIRESHAFLVLLTNEAVTKTGYIHKEIVQALDYAQKQPEGAIFIIPVKLQDVFIPERLNHLQWVNFFDVGGYEKLLRALRKREEELAAHRSLF